MRNPLLYKEEAIDRRALFKPPSSSVREGVRHLFVEGLDRQGIFTPAVTTRGTNYDTHRATREWRLICEDTRLGCILVRDCSPYLGVVLPEVVSKVLPVRLKIPNDSDSIRQSSPYTTLRIQREKSRPD
jgi:hypothetical protein